MAKRKNPFTGRWRIVSMEQYDQDYVDEEEDGYFEFTDRGWGDFHFGNVPPAVEWSWDGNDGCCPGPRLGGDTGR